MVNTQRGCTVMKKVIGSLLMSGVLLGTVVAPMIANADTVTENRNGQTSVSANFTASTSTVTPVDPTDPNKPSTDGDGNNGATAGGGLSLIYAPKSLDFGSHEIDVLNDESYTVDTSSASTKLWVSNAVLEVSDVRGTNAGWSLTATGDVLTDGTNPAEGATISLPTGTVTNSGTAANGAKSATTPTINLNGGATGVEVLSAAKDSGAGVTVDQMTPANIKLNIAANTVKAGTYSSNINWTLSDLPTE